MTRIFPDQVKIDGFWKIALSVIILWLIELGIQIIGGLIAIVAVVGQGCLIAIIGILAVMFAKVIALYIMDAVLPGFTMEGFWLKLLTAFACSILCLSYKRTETYY